jgi:hypothetical protein
MPKSRDVHPEPDTRLTVRLTPALKQALVARSQASGINLSRLVTEAIASFLADDSDPAEALAATVKDLVLRVERLEQSINSTDRSHPIELLPAFATPAGTSEPEPQPPDDPALWNPLNSSYDDWLFETWAKLAADAAHGSPVWGTPIPILQIHALGFYTMRQQRFMDRLLESEAAGLDLLIDHATYTGVENCNPQMLTFFQP